MDVQTLSPLVAFERRYRNDHLREHGLLFDADGVIIAENSGDYDSVSFTAEQLVAAAYGLLTHNHPRNLPPSSADVALAAQYRLTIRAVGIAPDTGEQFDHTVRFDNPSSQLSPALALAFEDEIELAERELSREPYGDLQWQREARHLALKRMATRFGFSYNRVQRQAALSEASRHERARLSILGGISEKLARDVWTPLHASLVASLARHAGPDGRIPIGSADIVRQQMSGLVQRTFLGSPLRDGTLAPYTTERGVTVPRSRYFTALWELLYAAALHAVRRHADMMRKYLPEDLIRAYEMATLDPFDTTLAEADGPQYDPLHLWLGADGKRLLDRIWVAAGDLRRNLDAYSTEAIAARKPVQVMARELEAFLVNGSGSYEALRLARTETAAAGWRADFLAAQQNPLVETYSFFTAPSHQCCDECDVVQSGGPYPKNDAAHLPPRHPNCICGIVWNMVKNIPSVVARLRDQLQHAVATATKAVTDWIGPLSKRFTDLLFRGRS